MTTKNNFYGKGGTTIKMIASGSGSNSKQKDYKLCKDTYEGHGGYSDGKYLFRNKREEDDDFDSRKEQAYNLNLVGPIMDSVIEPVFTQDIIRTFDAPLFVPFVDDADGKGAPLTDFTKAAIIASNVMGQAYIIIDSFPEDEIPDTQKEQIAERKVPYGELKTPLDVRSYKADKFNKLESITFFHGTDEGCEILRRYDDTYITEYYLKDGIEVLRSKTEHFAGRVPVITVEYGEILPEAPILSLAQTNRTLYNQLSELRELGRDSSFSLLVVPGNDPKVIIEVGPKNTLFVPQNVTNMPQYISPDQKVNANSLAEIKFTVESILSQGELKGASVQTGNMSVKSGVALAFEFHGNTNALNKNADRSEKVEVAMASLFGDYTVPFEYTVVYARDFSPFSKTELKAQWEFLSEALAQNLSPEINLEVKEQMLTLIKYNTSISSERFEELKLTIKSAQSNDALELVIEPGTD